DSKAEAKVKQLQRDRRDVLKKALAAREKEFDAGRGTLDTVIELSEKLLQAELDVATRKEQRLDAHTFHFDLMKKVEERIKAAHEAGRGTEADSLTAKAARLDAEVGWIKAGGKEK